MKIATKELILAGTFAAFTAVMAQIRITLPFLPVPLTMQIFAVSLTALILGSRYGTLSQIVYVLLGIVGAPVFSGFHSGPGVILGPGGGYIISFPVVAFVSGYICEHLKKPSVTSMTAAAAVGLLVCYTFGTVWLGIVNNLGFVKALILGAGWYLPLDALKIVLAAIIVRRMKHLLLRANLIITQNH